MAQLNFNAATVDPAQTFDPVPAGWYNCMMVESEMKPTSAGDGSFLSCTFEIVDGEYKGRKLFDRLNLQNKNPVAVEIAYKTLSAICHAVGVIQVADSSQLHNRPLQVKASYKPAGRGNDGKQYDASNEVKGYKAIEGAQAPANGWTPPPQGQAPQQQWAPPTNQAQPQQNGWTPQPTNQPPQGQPPAWGAAPQGQPQQAPQQWAPPQQQAPVNQSPQQAPLPQAPTPPWGAAPQQQPAPQQPQ